MAVGGGDWGLTVVVWCLALAVIVGERWWWWYGVVGEREGGQQLT